VAPFLFRVLRDRWRTSQSFRSFVTALWLIYLALCAGLLQVYTRWGTETYIATDAIGDIMGDGLIQLSYSSGPARATATPGEGPRLFGVQEVREGFRVLSWEERSGRLVQTTVDRVDSAELGAQFIHEFPKRESLSETQQASYIRQLASLFGGAESSCVESSLVPAKPDVFAVSPDGAFIAYACGPSIWRRPVGQAFGKADRLIPRLAGGYDVRQLVFAGDNTLAALVVRQGIGSITRWRLQHGPSEPYNVDRVGTGVIKALGTRFIYLNPENATAVVFRDYYQVRTLSLPLSLPGRTHLVAQDASAGPLAFAVGNGVFIASGSLMTTGSDAFTTRVTPGSITVLEHFEGEFFLAGGAFSGLQPISAQRVMPSFGSAWNPRLVAISPSRVAYVSPYEARVVSHRTGTRLTREGTYAVGFYGVAALFGSIFLLKALEERRRERAFREAPVSSVREPARSFSVGPPDVPEELVAACLSNDAVAFVGTAFGLLERRTNPPRLLETLLSWARTIRSDQQQSSHVESLDAALRKRDYETVADGLLNYVPRDQLVAEIGRLTLPGSSEPLWYGALRHSPIEAIVTSLIMPSDVRKLTPPGNQIIPQSRCEDVLASLHSRTPFTWALGGSVEAAGDVVLTPQEFARRAARNLELRDVLKNLCFTRTIVFVDASMETIQAFFRGMQLVDDIPPRHFALVEVSDATWTVKAASLRSQYGVQVLPIAPDKAPQYIQGFLKRLSDIVRTREANAPRQDVTGLKRIKLTNIGPFASLDVNLDRNWTILLGDNGVGKSTILRAIALAMMGKDGEPYAHRLIRSGERVARIELETNRATYQVEIERKSGGAQVVAGLAKPIDAEGWLVLGFPPVRSVSWQRPEGPRLEPPRSRGSAEDLMPLLGGGPDSRLVQLKQWIVDVDYQASKTGDPRYHALLQKFFQIAGIVTLGVRLEFVGVDNTTKEITVLTDDGKVPIEAISQGTASLIGWIGVLVQRLYDLYGEGVNLEQQYALVLIDEIDAHMHPSWQRTIVTRLRELFPAMQFIASTHSPLLIAGMEPREILVFRRNEDADVIVEQPQARVKGVLADEILTGPYFALPTTSDEKTERQRDLYARKLGGEALGQEEEAAAAEFEETARHGTSIRFADQTALDAVMGAIEQRIEQADPARKDRLLQEARLIIAGVDAGIDGGARPGTSVRAKEGDGDPRGQA
jgi:hypothetical protein